MSDTTNVSDNRIVAEGQLNPLPNNEGKKISKRPWTPEEDAILIEYVKKYGHEKWDDVQKHFKLDRTGKSCRFRYVNYLGPNLKKGPFTQEEQQQIFILHARFGNQWALIAKEMPGRRDNQIKNFWNSINKKNKRTSSPPDLPALPAPSCIENPIQSIGHFDGGNDEIQRKKIRAVDAHVGGNPESFRQAYKYFTGRPLPSLGSSLSIVSSQNLGSQVREIFRPGSLYDGRSIQPFVFSNGYGGAVSANRRLTNNVSYSTSRTYLGTEVAELPSLQYPRLQYHDQQLPEASYSRIYSPEDAVPIRRDSRFAKCALLEEEPFIEEADNRSSYDKMTFGNTVDNFELDELVDIDFLFDKFSDPTPQATGVSADELPSSQGQYSAGMETTLPEMQRDDGQLVQKPSTYGK